MLLFRDTLICSQMHTNMVRHTKKSEGKTTGGEVCTRGEYMGVSGLLLMLLGCGHMGVLSVPMSTFVLLIFGLFYSKRL